MILYNLKNFFAVLKFEFSVLIRRKFVSAMCVILLRFPFNIIDKSKLLYKQHSKFKI